MIKLRWLWSPWPRIQITTFTISYIRIGTIVTLMLHWQQQQKKTLIMCSFILFQTYQKPASSSSSDSDIVYLPRLLLLKSSTFEQLQRNNSDIESLKALTVSLTHQYVTIQINFISRNWKFDNLINIEFRPNIERAARKMHDSSKVR